MDKRFYDLLIIFDVREEKREKIISEITDIIKENDGTIEKIDEWGIKTLAYPIKKQTTGFYLLVRFQSSPSCILEISKVLKTEEMVLRFSAAKRKNPLPIEEEKKGGEDKKEVDE